MNIEVFNTSAFAGSEGIQDCIISIRWRDFEEVTIQAVSRANDGKAKQIARATGNATLPEVVDTCLELGRSLHSTQEPKFMVDVSGHGKYLQAALRKAGCERFYAASRYVRNRSQVGEGEPCQSEVAVRELNGFLMNSWAKSIIMDMLAEKVKSGDIEGPDCLPINPETDISEETLCLAMACFGLFTAPFRRVIP
jgi:hypothetical protein